jgi:NitT/TauT family transport system substrate-binding protein
MKHRPTIAAAIALLAAATTVLAAPKYPVMKLAVSEYPSWSLFLSAHDLGMIDSRAGKTGPIEEKWKVDIELKETDYDTCILLYGNGQVDAACLTDMDSLAPSLTVPSVAILPTSTSDGADQCIVTKDITKVQDLKGVKVFGLENSVSQYCFDRNLELLGEKPSDYLFTNQDPGAAALGLQQGQKTHRAIVVWNPFCMEVRRQNPNVHVLFSSSAIRGEIIDMVTMSRASLQKPGGREFACAVVDTYYSFNRRLDDPATADKTLVALGSRFSKMDIASMRTIVRETAFYGTPESGIELFEGDALKDVMKNVVAFCVRRGIVEQAPVLAYGDDAKAQLSFDPQYIRAVQARP